MKDCGVTRAQSHKHVILLFIVIRPHKQPTTATNKRRLRLRTRTRRANPVPPIRRRFELPSSRATEPPPNPFPSFQTHTLPRFFPSLLRHPLPPPRHPTRPLPPSPPTPLSFPMVRTLPQPSSHYPSPLASSHSFPHISGLLRHPRPRHLRHRRSPPWHPFPEGVGPRLLLQPLATGPRHARPSRRSPAAVIDGKIYVMGGRESGSDIWAEVLDPAVGRWEEVNRHNSPFEAMDGENRIYTVVGRRLAAYDPTRVERLWSGGWNGWACLVDGVLYSGNNHTEIIEGLEVEGVREGWRDKWKPVKGLWVLQRYLCSRAKLVDASGKLFLLWTRRQDGKRKRKYEIWCSQVEVHANNEDGELRATPSWYQKIHSSYEAFHIGEGFAVNLWRCCNWCYKNQCNCMYIHNNALWFYWVIMWPPSTFKIRCDRNNFSNWYIVVVMEFISIYYIWKKINKFSVYCRLLPSIYLQ